MYVNYYPREMCASNVICIASLSSLSISKPDRAKTMASQLASKGYFAGEAVGFRFGRSSGM